MNLATQLNLGDSQSGYNPAEFIVFLRSLNNNHLGDHCRRIPSKDKDNWVTIVDGLVDHFLRAFYQPDAVSWDGVQERLEVTETTLEVIRRVFLRVDGIFTGTEELLRKIFVRLMDFCRVLDLWIGAIENADALSKLQEYREMVISVLISVLRGLGDNNPVPGQQQTAGELLREILKEGLEVCRDVFVSSVPLSGNTILVFFGKPRILTTQSALTLNPDAESSPLHVVVNVVSQVPPFLTVILEVVARTVCAPLKFSWFLADILRMASEHACSLLVYYMSSTCPATSAARLQSISRLIYVTNPLRQQLECKAVLGSLPKRLFKFRLECPLELEWETIDPVLLNLFQSESDLLIVKELVLSAIQRLENVPASNELKVLIWGYLHHAFQKLGTEILTSLKESIENLPAGNERDDLLRDITSNLRFSNSTPALTKAKSQKGRLVMAPHIWRERVQNLVQGIIAPDSLQWMDDDDGMSVSQVCRRSLQEIQIRFEQRTLGSTTSEYRLEFLDRLSELPCFLAQCDKSDCFSQTNNKYLTISPYARVFIALLKGPTDEVTPQVRMKTFLTLVSVLSHHDGVDNVESILELVFRGLADVDRSVRLSAGRALGSLIRNYGLHGKEGYARAEVIFSKIYQFFESCKNSSRETLLITVASIGKDTNQDILSQVLGLIIAQLGRQNPVVKGLAAMQIASLAKHHQKAPYALILPHQEKLALFMVERLPVQPHILYETCKIMSIAPSDFINITLQHTLPVVCGNCDRTVLDCMAKEIPQFNKVLANHLPAILAHIFLLSTQLGTTTALSFLEKVIGDDNEASLMLSVIKVHVYSLLAALMVKVGDEDPRISERAISALRKVQGVLEPTLRGPRKLPDIRELLKTYMLGLVSQINDMLQDVQGKKSVDVKRKIIRGLGFLVAQVGESINNASPQIMATFQTMIGIPELSEVTLESWYKFLITLGHGDLGVHIGPTSAAIVASWKIFSSQARGVAYQALEYIIMTEDAKVREYLRDVVDLSMIDQLKPLSEQLKRIRSSDSPKEDLQRVLEQAASDNTTVVIQALQELKSFLLLDEHSKYIQEITSGDMFHPMVGQILASLLSAACRDNSYNGELLRRLAFECIGVLGAVDPDRCEIPSRTLSTVILKNFTDEEETTYFALHLIKDLLVGAFRATSDIKYQTSLAYSIQELLAFCRFTPAVVANRGTAVSIKTRKLWNSLPKHVLETVTPLLASRYAVSERPSQDLRLPIYPQQSTYREWIQLWAIHLISKTSGPMAQRLFNVFRSAVRSRDVVVAHHLLPHLVLHILISGNDGDADGVRIEMISVLEDQVDSQSNSTSDKKLLSAQAVFMLLDHINKWVRIVRQELANKPEVSKRARGGVYLEEQLARVDSTLSSIDQTLMAKAAFKCKAFARSLMNFEQRIVVMQERGTNENQLPDYFEKLHEIYAQLDEPDGMEGVSTLILAPTLEHQIREHESTGRWTSAQSCWEVRLQESPDNVEFHLGLLRCLRNLGHYDTLRTHVAGVLTRHPEWETILAGFQAESAWMVGAWSDVQKLVESVDTQTSSAVIARVLLAMREGNSDVVETMLSQARLVLGSPITAAGVGGYRRSYEAVLDLHLTHELEMIYKSTCALPQDSQDRSRQGRRRTIAELSKTLSRRLDLTLPTFRSREPVLSMRRTAFALSQKPLVRETGKSWLASAKIARKSKQWQTAYSAMLQAQQRKTPYCFIESARLLKATGEPLRALNELESSSTLLGLFNDQVVDLTADAESDRMKAKILILRARWMIDCDRFDSSAIFSVFQEAAVVQKTWESAHYYLGQYHDECFKALSPADQASRGLRMNAYTVKSYVKAIMHGSKFVYQTVPRMLTIWLDVGEDKRACQDDNYKKTTDSISRAFKDAPVYKWFTAFPQIVSRVGHDNTEVYKHLSALIVTIIQTYPLQALWLFASVIKSTKATREHRGRTILSQVQNHPRSQRANIQKLVQQSIHMTNELLALCDHHVDQGKYMLNMNKDFPSLKRMGRCDLIIPLQESLTASLPPTPETESMHYPFPADPPTFHDFADEIELMKSLAKPRKITIRGSNGQTYMFLGKPKDDLRKDARLMDLNAIINKLLKGNSESRKRQLHIRTYGVVTLNEECGFIQWVPNTTPIRPILHKYYEAKRVKPWTGDMDVVFKKIKDSVPPLTDKKCAELFKSKVLSIFMPVFHEWFIETFPEPTAWLTSRLTYGRSLAVMSMVGFILGLGDRHCENMLMDTNTGDVVHVDFNCLFERGKSLDTPERVAFRLTQNIVDGLGVTKVEGVFRVACEVTLQLLRDNKDSLMSVLDAFVHDPLVEWEDEKRKMDRDRDSSGKRSSSHTPKGKTDLRLLAKQALNPVEKKLKGIYSTNSKERIERELTTSNLVQMLIQEATDLGNLARMYPGWAPWH